MKKVKVKIAVVVTSDRQWASSGWGHVEDKAELNAHTLLDEMYEILNDITSESDIETVETMYWVTVELPIPEKEKPIEIEAESVEEAK